MYQVNKKVSYQVKDNKVYFTIIKGKNKGKTFVLPLNMVKGVSK